MVCCIDIGNSRTKIAKFDAKQLVNFKAIDNNNINEILSYLKQISPSEYRLCSVLESDHPLIKKLNENINIHPINRNSNFSIKIQYETAYTLGLDRIMAAEATSKLYPDSDCMIINAGTCITIDILEAGGNYLGGNITPGIMMRAKAMHEYTSKLPLIKLTAELETSLIGQNTYQALSNGVINGVIFELEGYFNGFQKKYPALKAVIAGGDADFLVKRLNFQTFAEPYLVLHGINQLY